MTIGSPELQTKTEFICKRPRIVNNRPLEHTLGYPCVEFNIPLVPCPFPIPPLLSRQSSPATEGVGVSAEQGI